MSDSNEKKNTQNQSSSKMFKSVIAIVLLIVLGTVLADTHIPLPTSNGPVSDAELKTLFHQFMHKYERMYGTDGDESERRFNIFKNNVDKARFYNSMVNDNVYGITKFSDMEESEFKSRYLMKNPITPEQYKSAVVRTSKVETVSKRMVDSAPDAWNWVDHGAVTPVKNQGACGSCWAFSTTGNVEGQWFLAKKQLVALSEQNLVDCDHTCDPKDTTSCDAGCNGGLMWNAMEYIIKNGGIDTEASYPYLGVDSTCAYKNATKGAYITSWKMLPTKEDELAAWLSANGPVSVAINAEWLQFYMGGISDPMWCNPQNLDHGVLLVGYGTGKTMFGTVKKYWIVKNSWGGSWGESGYFRIARGSDKCGIASVPVSASV